nr:hypothetical protein [Tanacetum cinerariifolium]
FFSQKNSLWVRVVKALHGEDGKIGKKVQPRWSWSLVGSGDFLVSTVRKLIDNAILPKGRLRGRSIPVLEDHRSILRVTTPCNSIDIRQYNSFRMNVRENHDETWKSNHEIIDNVKKN